MRSQGQICSLLSRGFKGCLAVLADVFKGIKDSGTYLAQRLRDPSVAEIFEGGLSSDG